MSPAPTLVHARPRPGRWVLVLFASVVVACNKGPAEDALRVADQAIAAAQPELETYAPGEFAALNAAVRQARAQVSEGHYTDALRAAQEVPARVRAGPGTAGTRPGNHTQNEIAGDEPWHYVWATSFLISRPTPPRAGSGSTTGSGTAG